MKTLRIMLKASLSFLKTDKGKVLYQIQPDFGHLIFEDFKTKMTTIKASLESQGYKLTDPISKTPDWRLIVGLGNESVYETLHDTPHTPTVFLIYPAVQLKA